MFFSPQRRQERKVRKKDKASFLFLGDLCVLGAFAVEKTSRSAPQQQRSPE
jgi:hypothetical protein